MNFDAIHLIPALIGGALRAADRMPLNVGYWDNAPLGDATSVVAGWYWPNVATGATWASSKLREVACDEGTCSNWVVANKHKS